MTLGDAQHLSLAARRGGDKGVSVAGRVEACKKGSAWLHPGLPSLCGDTIHRATVVTQVALGSSKAVRNKQCLTPERKGHALLAEFWARHGWQRRVVGTLRRGTPFPLPPAIAGELWVFTTEKFKQERALQEVYTLSIH